MNTDCVVQIVLCTSVILLCRLCCAHKLPCCVDCVVHISYLVVQTGHTLVVMLCRNAMCSLVVLFRLVVFLLELIC